MAKFVIKGGKPLYGEIKVWGSKNAVLPILSASLLTDEQCEISNVPQILDVFNFLEIVRSLGAEGEIEKNKVRIKGQNLSLKKLRKDLIGKLRGSILLLGSLLPKIGKVSIPYPGGDIIGARPIDTHINVFKSLGAKVKKKNHNLHISLRGRLTGSKIVLPEISVTATENALLCSVLAKGETVIKLAAIEPHVCDLAYFLKKMGAKIEGIGTHTLKVKGVKKLKGVSYKIIPDSDEAVSLIALAGATHSKIMIKNLDSEFIEGAISKLKEIGLNLRVFSREILVDRPKKRYKSVKLQSGLYPKLSTDQIPPMSILLTQSYGISLIHEWMYENRLSYLNELKKMGAETYILDPHRAIILGPSKLYGKEIKSLDIRAGITLLIAALCARGKSILDNVEQIDRGYEKIDQRLKKLGAEIKRET